MSGRIPTFSQGLKPLFHRGVMFGRDHVTLRVLDQFRGPTGVLEEVSNGPSVLDWNTDVTLSMHPKEVLLFKFLQPKTEFHWANEPCAQSDDANDAVRQRKMQHLLRHGATHAESTDDQRTCWRMARNFLFQLGQ